MRCQQWEAMDPKHRCRVALVLLLISDTKLLRRPPRWWRREDLDEAGRNKVHAATLFACQACIAFEASARRIKAC